jgi:hypothetical protein
MKSNEIILLGDLNTYVKVHSFYIVAEVADAQGNANPASLFNNHQVVISGQY